MQPPRPKSFDSDLPGPDSPFEQKSENSRLPDVAVSDEYLQQLLNSGSTSKPSASPDRPIVVDQIVVDQSDRALLERDRVGASSLTNLAANVEASGLASDPEVDSAHIASETASPAPPLEARPASDWARARAEESARAPRILDPSTSTARPDPVGSTVGTSVSPTVSPMTISEPAARLTSSSPAGDLREEPASPRPSGSNHLLWIGIGVVVIAAAVGGYFLFPPKAPNPAQTASASKPAGSFRASSANSGSAGSVGSVPENVVPTRNSQETTNPANRIPDKTTDKTADVTRYTTTIPAPKPADAKPAAVASPVAPSSSASAATPPAQLPAPVPAPAPASSPSVAASNPRPDSATNSFVPPTRPAPAVPVIAAANLNAAPEADDVPAAIRAVAGAGIRTNAAPAASLVANPPSQAPPAAASPNVSTGAAPPQATRLITVKLENVTPLKMVPPIYPSIARASRVQGTVVFAAVVTKEGKVTNLEPISGPSVLIQAATQAVSQWVYRPTIVNGAPADVATRIRVNFTLD
jgi:protein TonB